MAESRDPQSSTDQAGKGRLAPEVVQTLRTIHEERRLAIAESLPPLDSLRPPGRSTAWRPALAAATIAGIAASAVLLSNLWSPGDKADRPVLPAASNSPTATSTKAEVTIPSSFFSVPEVRNLAALNDVGNSTDQTTVPQAAVLRFTEERCPYLEFSDRSTTRYVPAAFSHGARGAISEEDALGVLPGPARPMSTEGDTVRLTILPEWVVAAGYEVVNGCKIPDSPDGIKHDYMIIIKFQ